jgi:2'-5' RNA ligase
MKIMADEGVRSFVAITLPENIKEMLFEVSTKLRDYLQQTRTYVTWVKQESHHITLKFLDSIDFELVDPILQKLEDVVRDVERFTMSIGEIGVFPNQNQPRVIWVGIQKGADKVYTLQKKVEDSLSDLGFEKEKREFSPHLTLGRIKSLGSRGDILRALRSLQEVDIGETTVERVCLMKSTLTPQGALYSELGSVSLKGG